MCYGEQGRPHSSLASTLTLSWGRSCGQTAPTSPPKRSTAGSLIDRARLGVGSTASAPTLCQLGALEFRLARRRTWASSAHVEPALAIHRYCTLMVLSLSRDC